MKKIQTQKGITLVALIITIVVLLILAAVAIGTVKNSDIIGYAQDAATGYQDKKESENNTITDMETLLNNFETEKSIPKYTEQEKDKLFDLIFEYTNNKYANYGQPTEEQLATANRAKANLLERGLNPDEAISIKNSVYFSDKKLILIEEQENAMSTGNYVFREVTTEEFGIFEELYRRAKVVDEKLDKGEYTTNGYNYYFDYNGEILEFVSMAGQYEYRYNKEYYLNVWNLPVGRCLGM